MKIILTTLGFLILSATLAWAECTYTYMMSNGRLVTCVTCCNNGYCQTNCY